MRRAFFLVVVMACAVTLGLLVSELAFRVAKRFVCVGRGDILFTPHPAVGWTHAPGRGGWQHTCLGYEFEFRNYVRINSKGLRDVEHEYQPAAGTRRVLLLGDSFTEAMQVPHELSFAGVLDSGLGDAVQVVNAGTAAYGTDNELLFFETEGSRYQPDLVVLVLSLENDIAENHPGIYEQIYSEGGMEPFAKPTLVIGEDGKLDFDHTRLREYMAANPVDELGRPRSWWRRFEGQFYLVRFIKRLLGFDDGVVSVSLPPYPVVVDVMAVPPDQRWEQAWQYTSLLLDRLRGAVESVGSRMVVVVVPSRNMIVKRWGGDNARPAGGKQRWDPLYPRDRAMRLLRELELPAVDISPALAEHYEQTGHHGFFDFDPHFTAEGHAVVARTAMPFLQRHLALAGGNGPVPDAATGGQGQQP